jgi:hypothetical protein
MKKRKSAGRPKIEINWEQFDKLCFIQCTLTEIASFFDCSPDTIERRCKVDKSLDFADYYKQKAAKGKISLRRKAFQLIESNNVTMIIFALKNILKWTDRFESSSADDDDVKAGKAPVVNFGFQKANGKK